MPKIRRGGYVFLAWAGDHEPRHVHVLKDGRLIAKWDLDHDRALTGDVPRRVRKLIQELVREGRL